MRQETGLQIGIVGTFDVENLGDVLFPLVADAELRCRIEGAELVAYSYRDKAPGAWPYEVRSLTGLDDDLEGLDALVIGGGHLVRFDQAVARFYAPPDLSIPHPTGYWLTPALAAAASGLPVAWNAPGMSAPTPAWARPYVALAAAVSSYVSVRDLESLQALRACGVTGPVATVPDTLFGAARALHELFSDEAAAAARLRLGVAGAYVVVQANRDALSAIDAFVATPAGSEATLVAVEIAPGLGDDARLVTDRYPQAVPARWWPDVRSLVQVIASGSGAIGLSLHLAVLSAIAGQPVLRPKGFGGGKYAIAGGLERVFEARSDGDGTLRFSEEVGRHQLAPELAPVPGALAAHWDDLAAALLAGPKRPRRAYGLVNPLLVEAERAAATEARAAEERAHLAGWRARAERAEAARAEARAEIEAVRAVTAQVEAELAATAERLATTWHHASVVEAELAAAAGREADLAAELAAAKGALDEVPERWRRRRR